MDANCYKLHVLLFPGFSHGHMLPMASLAKLLAARGVRATVLTTPANVPSIHQSLAGANGSLPELISFHIIPFPLAAVSGLPEGCENFYMCPRNLHLKFLLSLRLFRDPFKKVVGELLPDCVITDMFMPWTYDVAVELAVPRLALRGMGFFSHCIFDYMVRLWPLESLPPGTQSFELPAIPDRIEMLVSQIPDFHTAEIRGGEFLKHISEADAKSYGVVVNSFFELEPEYAKHYREVMGRRAWHVGPLELCNKDGSDQKEYCEYACLKWLDKKPPRSVVYVCFGSISTFTKAQLWELAVGMEDSGHSFIWVVGSGGSDDIEWVPEGFEESVREYGLIIRGWAPQVSILNHEAIGGFLTHCGWNSILEAVAAGIPMATWPLFADQFYNERLLVQVLKIGVEVGAVVCKEAAEERMIVKADQVSKALRILMGKGEEAEERRRTVMMLGKKGMEAMEVGGSSYEDVGCLIRELMERKLGGKRKGMGVSDESGVEKTAAENSFGRRGDSPRIRIDPFHHLMDKISLKDI